MASPDSPLSNHHISSWNANGGYRNTSMDAHTQGLDALSAAASRDPYPLQSQVSVPVDPTMGRNNINFNQPEIPASVSSIASPNHVRNTMPPPSSPSAS